MTSIAPISPIGTLHGSDDERLLHMLDDASGAAQALQSPALHPAAIHATDEGGSDVARVSGPGAATSQAVSTEMLRFGETFDLGVTAGRDLGDARNVDKILPPSTVLTGMPEPTEAPHAEARQTDWLAPQGSKHEHVTAHVDSAALTFATATSPASTVDAFSHTHLAGG